MWSWWCMRRWRSHHNLARAGNNMRAGFLKAVKNAGRFYSHIYLQVAPWEFARVLFGNNFNAFCADYQLAVFCAYLPAELPVHRVVRQKVCKVVDVAEVVDGDNLHLRVIPCRAEERAPYPAEPVYRNACHKLWQLHYPRILLILRGGRPKR